MLGKIEITAFVPTTDADKTRAFYEGVLGLRVISEEGFALVLEANGIKVAWFKDPNGNTLSVSEHAAWKKKSA
jgi:catechol 2,3-dioxygenase-like lactoylglutathione lyase family enzyme